jgi:hypothetical protein
VFLLKGKLEVDKAAVWSISVAAHLGVAIVFAILLRRSTLIPWAALLSFFLIFFATMWYYADRVR